MPERSLIGVLDGIRRHLRRRVGVSLVLAVAAVSGTVLVLAWLFAGPEGWRPGSPVPLLLLGWGVVAVVLLGGWSASSLRRWTREGSLAEEIERMARLPEGSVRAQAELVRVLPHGVSPDLVRAGEGALLGRLPWGPERLAGRAGRRVSRFLRLSGGAVAVALAAVVALGLLSPERARTAWAGLARPAALLAPHSLPPLQLRPGDARLPRGEIPRVEIVAPGRDSVTLHWQGVGELLQEQIVPVRDGLAHALLPPLEVELRYWASSADHARTREHRLTPWDPSLLSDLSVELTYPPHTRLPAETLSHLPRELAVPAGTLLGFTGEVGGEGYAVLLREEGGEAVARLPVEAGRFSGRWRPARSVTVAWAVEGGREGAVLPPPLVLELVPDGPPTLAVSLPGVEGEPPLSRRVPILLEAADDYGVAWIEIETALRAADGSVEGSVVDRVPTGDRPSVALRPILDFSEWGVRPGDEILLRARAADNAPIPQVVESETIVLRMALPPELRERARERISEAASRTEDLRDRAIREARGLREMERRARGEEAPLRTGEADPEAFRDGEEIRQALERQAELAREADELREELEEVRRSLPEEDPTDAGLRERIEALERLLEEMLDPEAQARIEELLDRLDGGEVPDTSAELLEEMLDRQEELQSRLEHALERLNRSVVEEAFREAEEEIQAMIEDQEQLAERLGGGEGAEEQMEMALRTEALEDRLAELEERLRRGGEPETADRTGEAGQELKDAREAMEEGVSESQGGNDAGAQEQGNEAAQGLQDALDQLEQARSDWTQQEEDRMQDSLQKGAQDALSLARRQGDLRQDFQNAGSNGGSDFEGDQAAVMEGLRNLANEMAAGTRQDPALGAQLAEAIREAMQAVQRTQESVRGGRVPPPSAGILAQDAERALQQVALLALSGMGDGGEGSGEGGASVDQILAELEALAVAQASLNQGTSDLGDESDQDEAGIRIQELAGNQRSIAGQLGELAERQGGQVPGSLEALSEEAERIAEELRGGRLDATTIERQERLLDRLLSAGRTLERDGPTEEREGTTAEATERRVVSPLPEVLLNELAVPLPSSEELEVLTPGQRRLVLEYFERINRREAGRP